MRRDFVENVFVLTNKQVEKIDKNVKNWKQIEICKNDKKWKDETSTKYPNIQKLISEC